MEQRPSVSPLPPHPTPLLIIIITNGLGNYIGRTENQLFIINKSWNIGEGDSAFEIIQSNNADKVIFLYKFMMLFCDIVTLIHAKFVLSSGISGFS